MKVKIRRRKLPVTASLSNGKPISKVGSSGSANPRASARVIRQFHVLLKRKTQLEKALQTAVDSNPEKRREIEEVEREIEELGGLEAYQHMSTIGQGEDRGGGSERVFIEWLKELRVRERIKEMGKGKLRLLEVGALKPDNYASCSKWIDIHPIDLRSTHPGIMEQDFLQMDLEENREVWDGISVSLVVNFVPEAHDRGRMLRLAHAMLREDGFLFLALPLHCVSNSRYLTFEHLSQLMEHIGFTTVRERWKTGGKMAYWLFRRCQNEIEMEQNKTRKEDVRFSKKAVLREGKRNNFCILL